MTIKDSIAVLDVKGAAARPLRRGEAAGAEIPVTVHASRTNQVLGKNLPPVHEETRTVIVLPQGAVVRLTATLAPGETVVLTNRMTGADVLCRVGNVKSQPGIQHYVDLEFTQRAPAFWGDNLPAQAQGDAASEAPAPAPAPSVPAMMAVKPPARVPQPPVVATPAPIANLLPSGQELRPTPLAESVSAPWPRQQANTVRPVRPPSPRGVVTDAAPGPSTPRLLATVPFAAEVGRGASLGSKRGVLVAAASVLLVVGAALGGYWYYGPGQRRSDPPAPQPVVNVPQNGATPPALSPVNAPVDDAVAAALNSTPPPAGADIIIESRPPLERPVNRNQPSSAPVARGSLPAVRRNNVAIGKMKAPVLRTLPSTSVSGEAPPMVVAAAVDLGIAGTDGILLAGAGTDAAPPPPSSRPAIGGQLQPPQLISSTPPVYPANARRQRVQGVVILDALVDETGKVVETTVITGPPSLQSAAKEALRYWKYQPARLNGEPIAVHTKVNLRFSLN